VIAYPVMLAAVGDHNGVFTGVHRTWIAADGSGKAPLGKDARRSLGPVVGGAVRLGMEDPCSDQTLIVAEGIESALAASLLLNNPPWAALSAIGIEKLILPDAVRRVQIAVDRDANGCGEAAARSAALRWQAEGRRVSLVIPDRIGADLNDLLREMRHAD
jgi:putative DNA primase/helicase